jgi:hypothetical protein
MPRPHRHPKPGPSAPVIALAGTRNGIVCHPDPTDALVRPAEWDAGWEQLFHHHPEILKPAELIRMTCSPEVRALQNSDRYHDQMHTYIMNLGGTCSIQWQLGIKVAEAFGRYDFERRWTAASVQTRREHALKGVANAGAQARNLNDIRMAASEIIRVERLARDPDVLLGLLRDATPNDLAAMPREPWYFLTPEWAALRAKHEREKATLSE